MNLQHEDLQINVCRERYDDEYPSKTNGVSVTIKHIPTGIEVCKHHYSAISARDAAIKDLKKLVEGKHSNTNI